MVNKPKILLIRESDQVAGQVDRAALEARGFGFEVATVSDDYTGTADEQSADAIILEMLTKSAAAASDAFCAHARSIAGDVHDRKIPILALCDPDSADDLMQSDSIDDVMHPPLTAGQIAGRVATLARLNTMHFELARRLETYSRYGLDAPDISPPEEVGDATILVVGNGSRFPVIEKALARKATIIGAFTRDTAEDYLLRRPFDGVVLDIPLEEASELLGHLRRNPRFYSLPILMLLPEADPDTRDILFETGATDIFVEPINPSELAAKMTNHVRENRFRDKLRAVYRQARHMATGDALTGLFSRGFALEHLDRVLKDQARWGEPLSLCGIAIENLPEINSEFGYAVGDRVIRQIGALIGQLVRGEDMTARWKGGDFLVILTSTNAEDATSAINRIRGVINHTSFSVEDIDAPISVRVDTHIIEALPNELPESVAKRAFLHS